MGRKHLWGAAKLKIVMALDSKVHFWVIKEWSLDKYFICFCAILVYIIHWNTGCLIMIDIKCQLIAQTKKHHWSIRQVAKFHWVWYILINTCQTNRKKHWCLGWPHQKCCSNLENLRKYIKKIKYFCLLFRLSLIFRFWQTKISYLVYWTMVC